MTTTTHTIDDMHLFGQSAEASTIGYQGGPVAVQGTVFQPSHAEFEDGDLVAWILRSATGRTFTVWND